MNNMEIYNAVRTVPQEAQKTIGAGRLKGMTDINPMWRLSMLTEQFGPAGIGWYYTIDKREIIDGAKDERCAIVDISLYIKMDGEWSKPIMGTGGSKFVTSERSGLYTSDEAYKMALTDAISVACKALGMGADVYWAAGRTKYNNGSEAPYPEADEAISEKDLKIIKGILSIYPMDSRETTKKLALAKYGVDRVEDLSKGDYVQFRNELIDSVNGIIPKRIDGYVREFAKKAGNTTEQAILILETGTGMNLKEINAGNYPLFLKKYKAMYDDLTIAQ